MSESRLHTDVVSTVDQMILQTISQHIEKELLSQFQCWSNSPGSDMNNEVYSLAEILSEDPAVVIKRKELIAQRNQYNDALKRVHEISPHAVTTLNK